MTYPYITLNNGTKIPQLGFGVWRIPDGKEVEAAVETALKTGYRLIDTAAAYRNEEGVGRAIKNSGISRSDLFVTTKLWNSDQGHDAALKAFDASLERLGMDYVDLYLIHWPLPKLDKYVETWEALEEIYKSGRAKAIGVSNFTSQHLERLLSETEVVPAVDQIELHPQFTQADTRRFCKAHDIAVESWSPLGGSKGKIFEDPTLAAIGKKYNKSPAQVIIRWHLQQGLIVIPKSTNAGRIAENFDVFDFELSSDDMEKVATLNTNTRYGADPDTADFS